jgi:predicted small secreted protein
MIRTRTLRRRWRFSHGRPTSREKIAVAQWSAFVLSAFIHCKDRRNDMLRKLVTIVIIGSSVAVAACNTVRGAAKDVNSAANAVDNAT